MKSYKNNTPLDTIRIPIDVIWKYVKICGDKCKSCGDKCKVYKIPDFFNMRNKVRKK